MIKQFSTVESTVNHEPEIHETGKPVVLLVVFSVDLRISNGFLSYELNKLYISISN